jgi:hypothetical protein
MLSLCVPS